MNTNTVAEGRYLPSVKEFLQMEMTFSLTVLAWIFFRAENIEHALSYLSTIFSKSLFTFPEYINNLYTVILLIAVFVIIEWNGRHEQFAIAKLGSGWKSPARFIIYYLIIIAIVVFMGKQQQFIYFQF